MAVDCAVERLGLDRETTVLDLGAGTGKLTRMLVERSDDVVAVEPLDGMRTVLESLVPEARSLLGTAESIPLRDGSVGAVFCAEAFHWFEGEPALAEIERVLRPRGGVALLWNVPHRPTEPSIASAWELLGQRGSPERQVDRYASGEWRKPFAGSRFEALEEAHFEHLQTVDREELFAFFESLSWIAVLAAVERQELIEEVGALLQADSYARFWRTALYWTRLAA